MRRPLFLFFLVSTSVASATGCASLYHLDEYTTADEKTGATPPPGSEVDGGTSPEGSTPDGSVPGASCNTNVECNRFAVGGAAGSIASGATPSVCVKATGRCAALTSVDCPRLSGNYLDDGAVVVGTLLGGTDATLEQAAFLAAEELDSSRGGGGLPATKGGKVRPLVVVGCNTTTEVARAAHHLVDDLHVPAIVGPTSGDDVMQVTQQISKQGGTLLVTPTSLVSSISKLADNDLTWRVVPSDTQRAKLVIAQMNDLENVLRTTRALTTVKLGVVHRTDAAGLSARDSISGKLIINGRFINDAANAANVSDDGYTMKPGVTSPLASVVSKYAGTFKPDLVFITAPEQIADLVTPLEAALTLARVVNKPYYICTDAVKTQAFLDAIDVAELPADIRRRVRGVGIKPDTGSVPVLDTFTAAFTQRYGTAPSPFPSALAYDALYAVAYGVAASPDAVPTGTSVAKGLRALGVGDAFTVGATQSASIMKTLAAGTSVSLRGTGSVMQWDTSGDIAGGTAEVWCIGAAAPAAFASGGLTMDVQTQVVGGAFVQCR
jgi:branched-chain amino acid transport system substrate-binding protein